MKIRAAYLLLVLLIFRISNSLCQSVTIDTTDYFSKVDEFIQAKVQKYGANQVLVVLDIDNTILTSDTDLGSDLWYRWQAGKLDLKPRPDQQLDQKCLFDEAICMLYELGTMSLTDNQLPGYIESWQKSGLTVFALTSRSPQCRPATERDLKQNGIDLSITPLRTAGGQDIYFNPDTESNLSYQKGIFMTKGGHKGKLLTDILQKSGRSFKSIIVADDGDTNINNFKSGASNYGASDITLFYYTKMMTDRLKENNNEELTPKQAKRMDKEWDRLIRLLNRTFPERMAKSLCAKCL